jgi:hypothetical protein
LSTRSTHGIRRFVLCFFGVLGVLAIFFSLIKRPVTAHRGSKKSPDILSL